MPRLVRIGPVGAAFAVYDVWRRLSPKQRKWLIQQTRTHGPRIAKQAMSAQAKRRKR